MSKDNNGDIPNTDNTPPANQAHQHNSDATESAPQSSVMGFIHKIEAWVARPTGWVLMGIFLILIASGNISYTTENYEISVSESLGRQFTFLFSLLGIVLITVGAISVTSSWTEGRVITRSAILLFCLMASVVVTSEYIYIIRGTDPYPFVDVKYNHMDKNIKVELSKKYLLKKQYKKYVLATTVHKLDHEYDTKDDVVFSSVFTAPQSEDGQLEQYINCADIYNKYRMGDVLRVHLIAIDDDVEIKKGQTSISDIDHGGKRLLRRFRVDVGVFDLDYNNLLIQYQNLESDEKTLFKNKIIGGAI